MNSLQKYLKDEYRDAPFQEYELMKHRRTGFPWGSVASFAGLCFLMANFLYWSP